MAVRWMTCWLVLLARPASAQAPAPQDPTLVLDAGGHTASVSRVLFSPDGRKLITVSLDQTIRTWDLASGEPLRVLRPPISPGHEAGLHAAALSRDGRLLAVAGRAQPDSPGRIDVLSTAGGRIERVLAGHTGPIRSLAFARLPDGRDLLASSGEDRTVRLWDAATGRCERVLRGHTAGVADIAFAPDGRRLITGSHDRTARIWSVAEGRCERVLEGRGGPVRCVAWSPDGATLATAYRDRSIRLWRPDGAPARDLEVLDAPANSLVFSADSKELLYTWGGTGWGRGAALRDVASGRERARFTGHDNSVFCGALSPDGALAATAGGESHEIYVWKTSDATPIHRLAGRGRIGRSAGWSTDGETIAWGCTSNPTSANRRGPLESTFRLADLRRGGPPDDSYRRAIEVRGPLSLVHSARKRVEVRQGDRVVTGLGVAATAHGFTFLGDEHVAVGTDAGNLLLFETRAGTAVRHFERQEGAIWAVAPSPDGRYLLTASGDQTLRIWAPDRDRPLLSFFFAADDWIAWTPEGYYAASPGGERLMGWQVDNGPEQCGTFLPADRFHKSLYRPEVIKLLLTTGSVARALEVLADRAAVAESAPAHRRPRARRPGSRGREVAVEAVRKVLPPVVVITQPDRSGIPLDRPELELHAVARAQPGHPVTALRVVVDGRPYQGDQARKAVEAARPAGEVREGWTIRLDPGRHRLAVVAESDVSNGLSDEIEVRYEEHRAAPPRLYVLAIGVSKYPGPLRLRFAAADAHALADLLRAKSARLFESVESQVLLDEEATRRNIIARLEGLRHSMRDGDVGLIFFSGHGAYRDDTFYLLPVDAEVGDLDATAVTADQLTKILATTRGRLMLLLDACHSGAETASFTPRGTTRRLAMAPPAAHIRRAALADAPPAPARLTGQQQGEDDRRARQLVPMADNLMRDLSSDEHGVITMSSSTAGEVSVESATLGHGYFTQALLEGLSGRADSNKDGLVYFNELDVYLYDRVKDLGKDRQHPVTAKPQSVRPFALTRP